MMAGEGGDIISALGWFDLEPQYGWAAVATLIASGSAGLRLAEKWFAAKGLQ